jgi:hypothetical protein
VSSAVEKTTVPTTDAADTPASDIECQLAAEEGGDAKGCIDPSTPPADLPSEDEARRIALDLLAATGMDVSGAAVTVDGPYDTWYVNVEPVLEGMPASGMASSVSVGSKGQVQFASGYLSEPEKVGDYDLVSTREAIDRLNEQMYGPFTAMDDVLVEGTGGGDGEVPPDEAVASEEPTSSAAPRDTTTVPATGGTTGGSDGCGTAGGVDGEELDIQIDCGSAMPCPQAEPPVEDLGSDTTTGGDDPVTTLATDPCSPTEPYIPPEPIEVVLHEATLSLLLVPSSDGSNDLYLVTAYRFPYELDDGGGATWVDAVAIAEEALAPVTTTPASGTMTLATRPAVEPAVEDAVDPAVAEE